MEKLPKREVEDLLLEEVPDIGYTDIGGLDTQIEAIRDAIELPYLYPKEYQEFNLSPPKGVLLYGPPGCGKTLIARAVASSIAERVRRKAVGRMFAATSSTLKDLNSSISMSAKLNGKSEKSSKKRATNRGKDSCYHLF